MTIGKFTYWIIIFFMFALIYIDARNTAIWLRNELNWYILRNVLIVTLVSRLTEITIKAIGLDW